MLTEKTIKLIGLNGFKIYYIIDVYRIKFDMKKFSFGEQKQKVA